MLPFILFASVIFGVPAWFVRSRKSLEKRHWTNQTTGEKILLSIVLASVFQFLFFLPGWIIAASTVGYYDVHSTPLTEFLFGIVALTSNTLIYTPFFYFVLKRLFGLNRKRKSLDEI